MTRLIPPTPSRPSWRHELTRLWQSRRAGARFWLAVLSLLWAGACMAGFPDTPSYAVLAHAGEVFWAVLALCAVLLLLGPLPTRLFGASLLALMFAAVCVSFTVGSGALTTASFLYAGLTALAFDVTAGGAQ